MGQGAWRLEGIRMCTSHLLGSRIKQFSIFFPPSLSNRTGLRLTNTHLFDRCCWRADMLMFSPSIPNCNCGPAHSCASDKFSSTVRTRPAPMKESPGMKKVKPANTLTKQQAPSHRNYHRWQLSGMDHLEHTFAAFTVDSQPCTSS